MARLWNAFYAFHWSPLVAFASRRSELALWFDDNVDARAVLDQEEILGVAVGHSSLRLQISRAGFDISVGRSFLDINDLSRAVEGMASVMHPKAVHMANARVSMTSALKGSYNDLREEFSRKFVPGLPSDMHCVDGAALVDIVTDDDSTIQAEYGVVTRDELSDRLSQPELTRVSGSARTPSSLAGESDVPDVAMFFDTLWRTSSHRSTIANEEPEEIVRYTMQSTALVQDKLSRFADGITDSFKLGRGDDELDRGA